MWRAPILIFLVLAALISGMLFWQWNSFSDSNEPVYENAGKVRQNITIESNKKELKISQKISGLSSEKEYRIVIPETLYKFECINEKGEVCESANKDAHTYQAHKNEMNFQYVIPLKTKSSAFMLSDWTASIPKVQIAETIIKITDSARRGGSWVSGIPLKGYKKMKLIDYYFFKGEGDSPSLYWQPAPLNENELEKGLVFYHQGDRVYEYSFKGINQLKAFPYLSVVYTDQYAEAIGKGIIITSKKTKKEILERKLIHYFYDKRFGTLSGNERWMPNVFSSYTAKQAPRTAKGEVLLNELKQKLSEEELKSFFFLVNKGTDLLNAQKLDSIMSDVKGFDTNFFSLNKDEELPLVPLYFIDSKVMNISGKKHKSLKMIYEGEKQLFPFIETMNALGFEVKTLADQETLLLTKGKNSFRFYLNRNIFIYNEDDYGLLQNPLTRLNGKVYIEQKWIQTIFRVHIEEREETINLIL